VHNLSSFQVSHTNAFFVTVWQGAIKQILMLDELQGKVIQLDVCEQFLAVVSSEFLCQEDLQL
jgi:hypothetical protein